MRLEVESYKGLVGCPFGSLPSLLIATLGNPEYQRRNRSGEVTYHYGDFIACFDHESGEFREATFANGAPVQLNGIAVDWTSEGLRLLCEQDGGPVEVHGAVLLLQLGVSITGIDDDDSGNRAISVFRKGDWDEFKADFRPWTGF